MRTYQVCDIDGFTSDGTEGNVQHYADNPTHTSHIGIGGDLSVPVPYSTGIPIIPQVVSDPASPTAGQMWVLAIGQVGTAGQAMGVLGLTYSDEVVQSYQLSYKASNGDIKRVGLS